MLCCGLRLCVDQTNASIVILRLSRRTSRIELRHDSVDVTFIITSTATHHHQSIPQVLTKLSPSFFGMYEFYRVDAQVRMNRGTNLEINSLQIFACNSKTKHHQATRLITDNNSEFKTLTSQSCCCCSLEIGSRGSCTRWTHRDRGTNTLPGTRGTCVAAAVPDELPDTGI